MPERRVALCSARRGALVVLVQDAADPTAEEWDSFLDDTEHAMNEHGGRCDVLVFTAGGKPDAAQRARSLDRGWRDNRQSRAVVVTDDFLARGVITAFAWFGLNIHALDSNRAADAIGLLELTEEEWSWTQEQRHILEARLSR